MFAIQVKEAALAFFGRKMLDGSLNGDEAAALGATLFVCGLFSSSLASRLHAPTATPTALSTGTLRSYRLPSDCATSPSTTYIRTQYAHQTVLSRHLSRAVHGMFVLFWSCSQASIKISGSEDSSDAEGDTSSIGKKPKLLFKVPCNQISPLCCCSCGSLHAGQH